MPHSAVVAILVAALIIYLVAALRYSERERYTLRKQLKLHSESADYFCRERNSWRNRCYALEGKSSDRPRADYHAVNGHDIQFNKRAVR